LAGVTTTRDYLSHQPAETDFFNTIRRKRTFGASPSSLLAYGCE